MFPVAYHFRVDFITASDPLDVRFQQVSGLNTRLLTYDIQEAENIIPLVHGVQHDDLVLSRGMAMGTEVSKAFKRAMEELVFLPQTIMVTLLDSYSEPQVCWRCLEARPKQWRIGEFNADSNSLVIETFEFTYKKLQQVEI